MHPGHMISNKSRKKGTDSHNKAIVVTGGPGMGKTLLINELGLLGYNTVHESGRQIIKQQIRVGGDRLPWIDRLAFAREMFRRSVLDFSNVHRNYGYTFFDRGLPDSIGYLLLCKIAVPEEMWLAAKEFRYHRKVYITPPWPEIYVNDDERTQSFEEAVNTFKIMHELYTGLGYEVIEIPKTTIYDRAMFILESLAEED